MKGSGARWSGEMSGPTIRSKTEIIFRKSWDGWGLVDCSADRKTGLGAGQFNWLVFTREDMSGGVRPCRFSCRGNWVAV